MKTKLKFLPTLVIIIVMSSLAIAQNNPIDFETGGFGATWTWTVFENGTNPPLEIIANPDISGANTSATVAKFTAQVAGAPFAGCVTPDIGVFTLDATNCTVKIMVWKSVISDVGIKFEAAAASTGEIKVANTLVNQWEELTFDFSGKIGEPSSTNIDALVIFPDFDTRTTENIIYFDNITFSEIISTPTEPTVAAPTPIYPASNVISLFSNAYTNVPVDTWSAVWDQADVTDVQIVGNDTKLYTNLVFAGIEFTTQTIDATAMTNFHMDIWTPDPTAIPAVFRIKLVDFGADGAFGGGDDSEHELIFDANTTPGLATGEWVSFDLPLTDFTGLTATGHLAQLIISGDPNTVYVDNVYFHTGVVPVEMTSFSASMADGSVMLEWTTATETNNSGFVVERSIDNESFNRIAFVEGNGTTAKSSDYIFVDNNPSTGMIYYRLKQVDFDGTYSYSDVVEVNNIVPANFSLEQNYPNPFNPSTKISFSLPEANDVQLKVFNLLGQEVATLVNEFMNAGKFEITFDAAELPTGVYIYSITAGNFNSVKKMMLVK